MAFGDRLGGGAGASPGDPKWGWLGQVSRKAIFLLEKSIPSMAHQSLSHICVDSGRKDRGRSSGLSASKKESTDLVLSRIGVRRLKLLGE